MAPGQVDLRFGNVWTDNTQIHTGPHKYYLFTGAKDNHPDDSLLAAAIAKNFTRCAMNMNTRYIFKPGISAYTTQSEFKVTVDPENRIIPIEMGSILSLDVSKGYYSHIPN